MGAGTLIPEAYQRRYHRVFICYKCGKKIRADPEKVRQGKVKCPRCGYKHFRPIRTEIKMK